jgi:hypothetical protein
MSYEDQRDAILVHAAAAALTANATFTNVAIGAPVPSGKCVRIFWGGEAEPARMGGNRVLNGELVAQTLGLVAFWPLPSKSEGVVKAIDDEMSTFIHSLRTRILADSQLGGEATDLEMGYAEPSFLVIDGARYATVEVPFTLDYIEYPLGA